MSETKDLSSQVQDTTQDTASKEQDSPGAFTVLQPSLALIVPIAVNLESVPRSGTGVVNDAGDVLDDAGNTVGKIADTDNLKNLVGNTVNTAGDVVSSSGDVLGKTLPIGKGKPEEEGGDSHDEENSEYTTQKDNKSGGLGDTVGGLTGAVGDTVGGVTGAVGDTAKGATDAVGDTTEGLGLGDTTKGVTDTVGDTAKGATDTVGDTTKGATDTVGDTLKSDQTSQATDTKTPAETPGAPEVKDETQTPDVKSEAQDQKEDISLEDRDVPAEGEDKLKEVPPEEAKETTDKAEDTAKDVPEEAKEDVTSKVDEQDVPKPEDVEDKLQEKTEGAKDQEELDPNEVPEIPKDEAPDPNEIPDIPEDEANKSKAPGDEISGDDGDKSKAPGDDLKSVAPGEEAAGVTDEVKSKAAEGEEAAEDKVAEGEEAAQDKVAEGEETAEGKVPEGDEAAGDVTEEAKDKAAEGEETAEGKVAEGDEAAQDKLAEGEEAAQDKAAEGEEAAEGKVAEGEEAAEDKVAEGEETAEGKVPEGEEAAGDVTEEAKDKAAEGEEAVEEKAAEGEEAAEDAKAPLDFTILKDTTVDKEGNLVNSKGDKLGHVVEGNLKQLIGLSSDDNGIIWDKTGKQIGKAEPIPEWDREQLDFSILEGTTVDKEGNLVNSKGDKLGRVIEGNLKQLIGLSADEQGIIWDKTGKQLGKAEPIPEWDREEKDFSILKGTTVDKNGNLVNDKGHLIGRVIEGEIKQLIGLTADDQGTIWDKTGKAVGKAEPLPEWERGEQKDYSILKGTTVDKNGFLVNEKGHFFGKVVEGEIKQLIGLASDDQGTIWDKTGKAVGKAEPLPEWERGEQKDFSILKGAIVDKEGGLTNDKGDTIGKVIEGEVRQLVGLKSDENGKIWRDGKVVGQAEPLAEWDRVQKKDRSILKGTKVNKSGKLVDANGTVLGKVVEGDLKELLGKRADENGDIWNESGEVIGKGEPVSVAEREDKGFAPFENFPGATVESDGRVMYQGQQVGEVIEGEVRQLVGLKSDENGKIWRDGKVVGQAEPLAEWDR
ncbi:hypothetical protein ACHAPJ_010020, partial [Fusarium lateritium]